jgi:hypothetical protein
MAVPLRGAQRPTFEFSLLTPNEEAPAHDCAPPFKNDSKSARSCGFIAASSPAGISECSLAVSDFKDVE